MFFRNVDVHWDCDYTHNYNWTVCTIARWYTLKKNLYHNVSAHCCEKLEIVDIRNVGEFENLKALTRLSAREDFIESLKWFVVAVRVQLSWHSSSDWESAWLLAGEYDCHVFWAGQLRLVGKKYKIRIFIIFRCTYIFKLCWIFRFSRYQVTVFRDFTQCSLFRDSEITRCSHIQGDWICFRWILKWFIGICLSSETSEQTDYTGRCKN